MPLVMGITIPAGLEIIYNKTLRMYDISVLCNVGKNPRFFPRSQKMTLREITYLFQIAYTWSQLSASDQEDWNWASNIIGQHGYNLYVQDTSYRLKNGIGGNATPSLYHQFLVGHLSISAPASSALLTQYNTHRLYWPASFELCFHSNLTASGANPSLKLRLIWVRYYSGQNIEETETIDLPLVSGWDKRKHYVIIKKGTKGRWRLELELTDVTGDLWFDNTFVEYSGEIKTNDPYCVDVVKWWEKTNCPSGVILETVYPQGGAL